MVSYFINFVQFMTVESNKILFCLIQLFCIRKSRVLLSFVKVGLFHARRSIVKLEYFIKVKVFCDSRSIL